MSDAATATGSSDSPSSLQFHNSLAAARTGAADAVAELLERFRPYLFAIAEQEFPSELAGKLAPSDVVQDTLLKGLERFPQFHGHTHEEFAGWLRAILRNHLATFVRSYATQKRDAGRELPAQSELADPFGSSPSGCALANETSNRLQAALGRLPEQTRQIILWRHRDDRSFAEIGAAIGKSEEAARKIWARAIEKLQQELERD